MREFFIFYVLFLFFAERKKENCSSLSKVRIVHYSLYLQFIWLLRGNKRNSTRKEYRRILLKTCLKEGEVEDQRGNQSHCKSIVKLNWVPGILCIAWVSFLYPRKRNNSSIYENIKWHIRRWCIPQIAQPGMLLKWLEMKV